MHVEARSRHGAHFERTLNLDALHSACQLHISYLHYTSPAGGVHCKNAASVTQARACDPKQFTFDKEQKNAAPLVHYTHLSPALPGLQLQSEWLHSQADAKLQ